MRTSRLPTVRVSMATTRCQYHGCRSSSKQVSTGLQWWPPDVSTRGIAPSYDVWGGGRSQVWCLGRGVGPYPMMHIMYLLPPPPHEQTERCLRKHYLPQTSFSGGNKKYLLWVMKFCNLVSQNNLDDFFLGKLRFEDFFEVWWNLQYFLSKKVAP